MTKKSTKQVKKAMKDLPKAKTSEYFMENAKWKDDRPEWDQVQFSNGKVYVGNGMHVHARTWKVFTGLLWIILSMPIYIGIWNSINSNKSEDSLVPAPIDNVKVAPDTFEAPVDGTSAGELETIEEWFSDLEPPINTLWEEAESFGEAFNLARTYLGPQGTFMWHDNEYHTLFKEEVEVN